MEGAVGTGAGLPPPAGGAGARREDPCSWELTLDRLRDPTGESGGREQTCNKKPALTSSLAPSPRGVLAADVFHKVQNDKKPRNQSQVHSNPVMFPFLLFFFFSSLMILNVLEI